MLTQNYTNFFLLLLSFSLLFLTGCKEEENMRVRSSIEKAIEIGETQPNEARIILDSIQTKDLSKESFMLYQIADVQTTYYTRKPLRRDQANRIAEVAKYFENKQDSKHAALANFYAGVAYYHIDELVMGFAHYLKSYPYAKAINDSLLMGKSLFNQALMYQDQKVYDSVTVCLEKAVLVFKDKPDRLFRTYQTMAFNYYVLGDSDKALETIEKCIPLEQGLHNEDYIKLYRNTYGLIYMNRGDYEKSLAYFFKNIEKQNIPKEQLQTYFNIAKVYTLAHNTDSAKYYIDKAKPLLTDLENQYSKLISENYLLLWGYDVLKGYYKETNNHEKYLTYKQLFDEKDREIIDVNLGRKFLEVNKLIDIQQIINDNKLHQTRVLACIIVLCILFFMLALFIIHKHVRKRSEVNINLKLVSINNHRKELDRMKRDECRILK